jgi:hypothetical protein
VGQFAGLDSGGELAGKFGDVGCVVGTLQHDAPAVVQFQGWAFYYYFAKDGSDCYQITAAGNRHKATAEQVLNQFHLRWPR